MTKEEFEQGYADRSKMTVERMHELGMEARPCDCGKEGCEGWAMLFIHKVRAQLLDGEVTASGRRYSEAARKNAVEQLGGQLVFADAANTRLLSLSSAVGRVRGAELEGGKVMIEVEGLTDMGKFLVAELEAGRTRVYSIGHAPLHSLEDEQPEDGVRVVGADYVMTGVGIEPVRKPEDPE